MSLSKVFVDSIAYEISQNTIEENLKFTNSDCNIFFHKYINVYVSYVSQVVSYAQIISHNEKTRR